MRGFFPILICFYAPPSPICVLIVVTYGVYAMRPALGFPSHRKSLLAAVLLTMLGIVVIEMAFHLHALLIHYA